MSRVLLIPGLLEEILLLLPTLDLMVSYNASLVFRNCILASLGLQMRELWLRPKKAFLTWYMWTRQRLHPHGLAMEGEYCEKLKLVQLASNKTVDLEFKCQLAPVQPTTLCPLAQLWISREKREKNGRPRRAMENESHTSNVAIIATPAELELYGDMIFANPPTYEARHDVLQTQPARELLHHRRARCQE
jgi:hypothetical protein